MNDSAGHPNVTTRQVLLLLALGVLLLVANSIIPRATVDLSAARSPVDIRTPLGTDAVGRGFARMLLEATSLLAVSGVILAGIVMLIAVATVVVVSAGSRGVPAPVRAFARVLLGLPSGLVVILAVLRRPTGGATFLVAVGLLTVAFHLERLLKEVERVQLSASVVAAREYVRTPLRVAVAYVLPECMAVIRHIGRDAAIKLLAFDGMIAFVGYRVWDGRQSMGILCSELFSALGSGAVGSVIQITALVLTTLVCAGWLFRLVDGLMSRFALLYRSI